MEMGAANARSRSKLIHLFYFVLSIWYDVIAELVAV